MPRPAHPAAWSVAAALRAMWRLAGVLTWIVLGWLEISLCFHRLTPAERGVRVRRWAGRMLHAFGVRLEVRGAPANGPMLVVPNHISWLDILALHAAGYARFISKADVARWPVIGALATGGGTLYIERTSRRDALRVVHRMAEALAAGDTLAVFPEGTTSDGAGVLPFHANLLQAAISAGVPALPVGLSYIDDESGRPNAAVRYVDEDTLVGSAWRLLGASGVRAVVAYGDPQQCGGRDRRAWAAALRDEVRMLRRLTQ